MHRPACGWTAGSRYNALSVLGRKDGESVAIEVETGKSNVVRNVKEDLLAGFTSVLVVATDQKAVKSVERDLARAGLLVPPRVQLALRDSLPGALS